MLFTFFTQKQYLEPSSLLLSPPQNSLFVLSIHGTFFYLYSFFIDLPLGPLPLSFPFVICRSIFSITLFALFIDYPGYPDLLFLFGGERQWSALALSTIYVIMEGLAIRSPLSGFGDRAAVVSVAAVCTCEADETRTH